MHYILTSNHSIQTCDFPRIRMMTTPEGNVHCYSITSAHDSVLNEIEAKFIEHCAAHDCGDAKHRVSDNWKRDRLE